MSPPSRHLPPNLKNCTDIFLTKMDLLWARTVCRTCVNTSENIVKIENTFISYGEATIPLLQVLNLFTQIELNQSLPDGICSNCIEKADIAYKFKLQCDQSSRIFTSLLETNPQDLQTEVVTDSPVKHESHSRKKRDSKKRNFNGELFFCNECNKPFKNKYILSAHLDRHKYKGQFLCTICGKSFNAPSCLTRHTRVHTGEKNYECEVCHRRFSSSNNLNLHSRTHTGVKPYLCTICGKSFSHPTGLTYHTRTHTKEKPYTCDLCGRSFAIQCHMDRHKKTHSGERPFQCDQCEKGFIKKIDLQRHQAVHTGCKPHVCSICNKAFLRKMHLTYHMMLHTKERPHVCEICGKGFIRRYCLKDHMNTRHGAIEGHNTGVKNT